MKQARIVLTALNFADLVEGREVVKDVGTPSASTYASENSFSGVTRVNGPWALREEVLRVFIELEDIGFLEMMHAVVLASKNAERRRVESSR